MERFKNTHLWLLIPFVIIMLGFMPSYWLRFTDAPWRQHLHGLTATLWFVILIVQPYLISRGHKEKHRFFGMLALFVAGGVALSALATIPYNLSNERLIDSGRYGLSFVDVILIFGFSAAVIMAIKTAKSPEDHAKWMLSTVFWVISPGLFRVFIMPFIIVQAADIEAKVPYILAATGVVNLVVLAWLMFRDKKAHPAYLSVAIGSLVMLVAFQVGDMEWWRSLADGLFTH